MKHKAAFAASALALAAPALAADSTTMLLLPLVAIATGLLIYTASLAWQWLGKLRNPPADASQPGDAGLDAMPEQPGLLQLVDYLHLQPGLVIHLLRVGERLVLVASREGAIASLGEFPLHWIESAPVDLTYTPPRHKTSARRLAPPRTRDEREWQRQREELIRQLQRRAS